jgi:multidrug efflux pump subunit AcrA (membrane-fusion protein)
MENFEHIPTARGRLFLWGGIAAGLMLLLALYTRGFALFGRHVGEAETPLLEHRGAQIFIPESSPLRQRLTVVPAAEESVSGNVLAPGVVESDPARTALLLSAVAGRVKEVKVSPGSRVSAGQALAVIDSPDLAQAYDDDAKASIRSARWRSAILTRRAAITRRRPPSTRARRRTCVPSGLPRTRSSAPASSPCGRRLTAA